MANKDVFVSYAKKDISIASKFKDILNGLFDKSIWMKDFDLNGGDLVLDSINEALSEAKWFVILLSSNSIESKWLKHEADIATFRTLSDLDFGIITIKIDSCEVPPHLKIAIKKYVYSDVSEKSDIDSEFLDIASYIEKTESTHKKINLFIDRGDDADSFSLLARQNNIIFILGFAGIGKSAFISNRVAQRLGKRPLKVSFTRGHSIDLFSRQVIRETRTNIQPLKEQELNEQYLLQTAIESLKYRSEYFFLFIDNAENGLDESNQVLEYLEKFLISFSEANIKTHVVLATSRYPSYSPELAKYSSLQKLNRMSDIFIKECIDIWLEDIPTREQILQSDDFSEIIKLISGHPLAAKMIASQLRVKPYSLLVTDSAKRHFRLRLAEFILKEVKKSLTKLHYSILYILSVVKEPITFEDLFSTSVIQEYSIDDVHVARSELLDWFLIFQEFELISISPLRKVRKMGNSGIILCNISYMIYN